MLSEINYKSRKFAAFLAVLATLIAFPVVLSTAGTIETLYFPVINSFTIDNSLVTGDNATVIEGTLDRNRNCKFIAVGWFLRKGDVDVAIPIERVPRSPNRPIGTYRFGPWKLFASRQEIEDNGYAVVYHRCHPLYVTESYIYAKGKTR